MNVLGKDLPKILVFSTEKISDPAISMAGLLKLHYSPRVYTITLPCSSAIKTRWILKAYKDGFDGVFIAADGTDCPFDESCTVKTGVIVGKTQEKMKELGIDPARLKMAAICSICSEPFVKHMKSFTEFLIKSKKQTIS